MSSRNNKVYFPVESMVGLGHFNRTGKLVREMIKAGLAVTVASSTFVDPKRFFAGAELRDIPGYAFKNGEDYYMVRADGKRELLPNFNEAAYKGVRTNAHLKNVAELAPGIVITELWPFDRPFFDPEMTALMTNATSRGALRIASVRDVLDTRDPAEMNDEEKAKKAKRDAAAVRILNENYDAVLVHGDPNFTPLRDTFPLADQIKTKIIYTGYVLDDLPARKAPATGTGEFLVSCGSGVDADEMMLSFVTAWQKLLDRAAYDTQAAHMVSRPLHIICGPRFSEKTYGHLEQWAQDMKATYSCDIKLERYRTDYTQVLAEAAFSLSFAGYNTTLETLAIGTPALMVPKYAYVSNKLRYSTEQLYRLEQLQEKGYARYAHPEDVQHSGKFADILLQEFTAQTTKNIPKAQLNFDGAKNSMAAISQLLEEKKGVRIAPAARTRPKRAAGAQ